MFGKIRYFRGVNRCIAEIGVDRGRVHPAFRREIKNVGYWYKNTPEECATAMLYHMAAGHRPEGYDVVLSDWIDRGLVRRNVLESIVHSV
ncbi:MAG: hypothetical protein AAGG65_01580 [Pseudomonadota bacterium]